MEDEKEEIDCQGDSTRFSTMSTNDLPLEPSQQPIEIEIMEQFF